MERPVPFTFGIPVLPRACAQDWSLVERLLSLTLASVFAQTDPGFRVLIVGHERPSVDLADPRVQFLQADWPVEAIQPDNRDRGRKAHMINRRVVESGGGLLMLLDADDWVDRRLVATSRSQIGPELVGGVIQSGYAVDFSSGRAAVIPQARIFDDAFHRICGSSSVIRIQPNSADPVYANPYELLHEHHRLPETSALHGAEVMELNTVAGGYLINTSENHSELHGPFASWRRDFTRAVNRFGSPVSRELAAQFGVQELFA